MTIEVYRENLSELCDSLNAYLKLEFSSTKTAPLIKRLTQLAARRRSQGIDKYRDTLVEAAEILDRLYGGKTDYGYRWDADDILEAELTRLNDCLILGVLPVFVKFDEADSLKKIQYPSTSSTLRYQKVSEKYIKAFGELADYVDIHNVLDYDLDLASDELERDYLTKVRAAVIVL